MLDREAEATPGDGKAEGAVRGSDWTFLSNHATVLLCIAKQPEVRLRDMAERVGITERAVHRIVADLEEGGYLTRVREGRRNRYELHPDRPFRHPVAAHRDVNLLIELFLGAGPREGSALE